MTSVKKKKSSYKKLSSAVEDMMLKNPDLAPIALTKQAVEFMRRFELTQAGTQLRRCREVLDRNVKTVLKSLE